MDVAALAKLGGVKKYGIDELFFNAGDPGHEMYIILRGRVGVYLNSIDGFPIMVATLGPGDFFGEMSLLEGMPRSATIGAIEDTIVLIINENNFEQVIAQQPGLAYRIMKGISGRLRQQNDEIKQLKQGAAVQTRTTSPTAAASPAPAGAEKASPPPVLDATLFPPGHKSYQLDAAATDDVLLFDRDVECPVCEQKFKVKNVRSSKLRLDKVDNDLRQRFVDFEPLYYMVWNCPNCFYSNFNFEFKQVLEANKKLIIEKSKTLKGKFNLQFSSPRKIDEVFLTYYLMLQTFQVGKQDPSNAAKVWLRLSWLYNDVNDEEMYRFSSQKALDLFKDSFFNARRDTSVEQDQRMSLLLGELSLRVGEKVEALKFYRGAIARKGGNATINRQAEDRIRELKATMQEPEEESEESEESK
ncbi:MAG: DUF2225 domain-containing protein [Syntrophomonadaceae bacterium]|nr:DUF2225 domain-containing protein [Syntrophomonadaceae bacterium]